MPLAPEGWPFILPWWALVALTGWGASRTGSWWAWTLTGLLAVVGVWMVAFFRNPRRTGPRGDRYVIAPADGTIVGVAEVDEPAFLKGRAVRISIFMSVFNVHVNRYPVSGVVEYRQYNAGRFLHAASEKASLDNEQSSVGIRSPRGPVLVRQIAGLIARRIVTDASVGARVAQGDRLGMIRFGSRVDVFVPAAAGVRVAVAPGATVRAGATVLAEYP